MTQHSYAHPPITEAVIEICFDKPLESAQLEKISSKFSSNYPDQQIVTNLEVAVGTDTNEQGALRVKQANGYRRSSSDMTQLMVLWESKFIISQLAPYPGWAAFFTRFDRDWKKWKKVAGHRKITRIGVRYINRIDIPSPEAFAEHEEYLNIYPRIPNNIGLLNEYAVQAQFTIAEIKSKLTLNSAVVESPLLGYISIVVDQDIARDTATPQSDEEIYKLLNDIRAKKNSVFEDCITNRSRELFQR